MRKHKKVIYCLLKGCNKDVGRYRYKFCSDKHARDYNNAAKAAVARSVRRKRKIVGLYEGLKCFNPLCEVTLTGSRRTYCSEKCSKETRRFVFNSEMHLK